MNKDTKQIELSKELSKDIWQLILNLLDTPIDFFNASQVCGASYRASLILKASKALQFSSLREHYRNGKLFKKYYILPNDCIHGVFETYDLVDKAENVFSCSKKYFAYGRSVSKKDFLKLR